MVIWSSQSVIQITAFLVKLHVKRAMLLTMGKWLVVKNRYNLIFESWKYYKNVWCNESMQMELYTNTQTKVFTQHLWDEKILKMFSRRQLGVKSTTSYQVMLSETCVQPIEIFALQRLYIYITKVKNMWNHILPHLGWNARGKLQKNHNTKFSH